MKDEKRKDDINNAFQSVAKAFGIKLFLTAWCIEDDLQDAKNTFQVVGEGSKKNLLSLAMGSAEMIGKHQEE